MKMAEIRKEDLSAIMESIEAIEATGLHTKPVSEEEKTQRIRLIADFGSAMETLIQNFSDKAENIGGYYRSAGIKDELNKELRSFKFY
jgi:ribosomal 50S subunit-associated protein YjgA (DUF615 family)